MDMHVRYDTLCMVEKNLDQINIDLMRSVNQMVGAIRKSQDYLSGNQFEKAVVTTNACVQLTNDTVSNIKFAKEYIEKLKILLDEYENCEYNGELT